VCSDRATTENYLVQNKNSKPVGANTQNYLVQNKPDQGESWECNCSTTKQDSYILKAPRDVPCYEDIKMQQSFLNTGKQWRYCKE
jgi:hypothetical protein